MNENRIGLKLANGEFYPVLREGVVARKRLIVTTVQDEQLSVQIDLYRGEGQTTEGASYIGSLVIEGIPPKAKGEPDIRLDLGLTEDGTLSAFAEEASSKASQSLNVSLEALAEEEKYEIPDFEFSAESPQEEKAEVSFADEDFEGTDSLPAEDESARLLADVGADAQADEAKAKSQRKPLLIAAIAVGALAAALGIGYLVYSLVTGAPARTAPPSAPTLPAVELPKPAPSLAAAPPAAPPAESPPAEPPPTAEAHAAPSPSPKAPELPVPAKVATSGPAGGISHRIKWGDTLWDLSYAYYRNPWIYMKIAKANKIKNPDLIISGTKIWIPPR